MSHTPIPRRQFLRTTALSAAGLALLAEDSRAPAQLQRRPPNLLFIHVDQQNAEILGAYGCDHVHTPNMDRLAQRGVSFLASYSANPVCCPARSCWYTGRASSETGVVMNSWPIVEGMPDLGQWFSARGYEAVYAGKWHIPGRALTKSFRVLTAACGQGEHGDAATSRAAQGFLRNYRGDKPFFLSLGFLQPHDCCYWVFGHGPSIAELPYPSIADKVPPLPANFQYDPNEPETFQKLWRGPNHANLKWSELHWRYYLWSYDRHVEMVDAEVGRVLDALDDSAYAHNTLVVFSSDHGDGVGRHQMVSKHFLYDEAVRVPLIVAWPGQVREGVQDREHVVSGLDIPSTLCDYAGIEAPPKARGRSLRPLLEGSSTEWREFVVSESHVTGRMVRTPEWKLITYRGDQTDQLFDMRDDPGETRNLAGQAKHADVVSDLKKRLNEWEARLEPVSLEGRGPLGVKPKGKA